MSKKGRVHSSAFKIKVALTEIRWQHTMAEICQMYQLHSSVVGRWKRQLLEEGQVVLEDPSVSSSSKGQMVGKVHSTWKRWFYYRRKKKKVKANTMSVLVTRAKLDTLF